MARHVGFVVLAVLTLVPHCVGTAEAKSRALTAKEKKVLAGMNPEKALRYFSGNACASHNLPAMFAVRGDGEEKLVVVGDCCHQVFRVKAFEEARSKYLSLLKARGYLGAPFPGMSSTKGVQFTEQEETALDHFSCTDGFRYFSGKTNERHDLPLIYAFAEQGVQRLVVVGRSCDESFVAVDFDKAITRYEALLKERGFHPE